MYFTDGDDHQQQSAFPVIVEDALIGATAPARSTDDAAAQSSLMSTTTTTKLLIMSESESNAAAATTSLGQEAAMDGKNDAPAADALVVEAASSIGSDANETRNLDQVCAIMYRRIKH